MQKNLPNGMRKISSAAKAAVITKAELYLKRRLTSKEITIVAGLDDVPARVIAEEWTGQQIEEYFIERTQPDDPVLMLESMACAEASTNSALNRLISFQRGKAKEIIEAFSFKTTMADFSVWLLRLLETHKLPPKTNVLKFGLLEQNRTTKIYVSGYVSCDTESSDWARRPIWWRENYFTELNELSALGRKLARTKSTPWITVQAITILLIQEFFKKHSDKFRKITGLRRVVVMTGFDDGDLYKVQTVISPDGQGDAMLKKI